MPSGCSPTLVNTVSAGFGPKDDDDEHDDNGVIIPALIQQRS